MKQTLRMVRMVRPLTNVLDRVLAALGAVALILMMLHVVLNAVLRQYFRSPIYGTNELVEYWWLPVVTLLGIVAAFIRGEHISVALFYDRMKPGNQREFRILADIIGVLVSAAFAWFGLLEAIKKMGFGATAGFTAIPMWPVLFMIPLVFTLLALLYLLSLIVDLRGGGGELFSESEAVEIGAMKSGVEDTSALRPEDEKRLS